MKYDDASWHFEGEFPEDLPESAGAIHIATFVAWAMLNELAGELHTEESSDELAKLRNREISPVTWFEIACDWKFTDEDLNEVGNRFALIYYQGNDDGGYLADYTAAFPEVETLYHVPDGWETYDKLAPVINERFEAWTRAA